MAFDAGGLVDADTYYGPERVRRNMEGGPSQAEQLEVSFRVQNQTSSDIQDLSNIHPDSTNDFEVEARKGTEFVASVNIGESATTWYAFGLEANEKWGLFHKLDQLFEARKRPWKKWLHAHSKTAGLISGMGVGLALSALVTLVAFSVVLVVRPAGSAKIPRSSVIVSAALVVAFLIAFLLFSPWVSLRSHSIVVFRRRAEHAARGREGATKVVLEISKIIIGFLLGVLTLYLKHKYWP